MICVEYYHQRMTREELKKALPEMVMFAKMKRREFTLKNYNRINQMMSFIQLLMNL